MTAADALDWDYTRLASTYDLRADYHAGLVEQTLQRLGLPPGAWALEVGALSVLYGWDDTALRSCARYPADLVDYARSRLAQTADSGDA